MTLREILIRKGIPWRSAPPDCVYINCLFCVQNGETPDTRFRLRIGLTTGQARCFHCSYSSWCCFKAVLRKLQMRETNIQGDEPTPEEKERPHLPDDFQVLKQADNDLDQMALKYLWDRGVTKQQVADKRIGISLMGRYAYRVIFPMWYEHRLVGIVARDFTGHQDRRYLNSKGDKGLYNYGKAERVVLSEGIFKALRIERLNTGFRSMATLGNRITDFQITELKNGGCKEIILWPDPDKPGREGVGDMASRLIKAGFLLGVVWPVYAAADEEPLESMQETWGRVEGYSWGLKERIGLGVLT